MNVTQFAKIYNRRRLYIQTFIIYKMKFFFFYKMQVMFANLSQCKVYFWLAKKVEAIA